jgi:lysine-N-methylase
MADVYMVRQPQCFDRFHCTAADCEDTCCIGWEILVAQENYEKYQTLSEQRIGGS